ncbi:MAG: Txe/YoeB family addiction module toxin [Lewinellaceae bacterium]|nr:Txe/YoeB family addiction module toxin [Lewinellaceae bacterium]
MNYILRFSDTAIKHIKQHKNFGNKAVIDKITLLFEELTKHPFIGTGKPEPLKHNLAGYWSRRINREHRLVYEVTDDIVLILSAKGHY